MHHLKVDVRIFLVRGFCRHSGSWCPTWLVTSKKARWQSCTQSNSAGPLKCPRRDADRSWEKSRSGTQLQGCLCRKSMKPPGSNAQGSNYDRDASRNSSWRVGVWHAAGDRERRALPPHLPSRCLGRNCFNYNLLNIYKQWFLCLKIEPPL